MDKYMENIIIPRVSENRGGSFFEGDIYSYLLSKRIIFLTGNIGQQSANIVIAQFLYLNTKESDKPITLYINSSGGDVHSGLAIYDTMRHIKSDVSTICIGNAASMGAMLLTLGTKGKRYALKHTKIMTHQPSFHFKETNMRAIDMQIYARDINEGHDTLAKLISDATGNTIERVKEDMREDKFFSADEAKEYGLIDHVL